MRLLALFFCLVFGPFVAAQDPERTSLLLAGFPLLDQDQQLRGNDRTRVLDSLQALKDCCDIQVVIVIQDGSLTGNSQQDLQTLRTQLERTELWTDQTIIMVLQANPRQVLVARPLSLRQETSALTKAETDRLSELLETSRLATGLSETLAKIEETYRAQRLSREQGAPLFSFPIWMQEALLHGAVFLGAGVLALLLTRFRQAGADRLILDADFILPRVSRIPKDLPRSVINGAVNLMIIRQSGPIRHRGGLFVFAFLAGGLVFVLSEGARLIELQPWYFRAGITVAIFCATLLVLMGTRLGAWLTSPGARRTQLKAAVNQLVCLPISPSLVFLHQAHRNRVEVWFTKDMPIAPELLRQQLARLEADAMHGVFPEGLEKFITQFDRLARTYAQGELTGQIIQEKI